ncbi:MAG: Gfo/Idh/MocA family oxidoreductase [Bauldia sp.]|uniref:Gfo/Idh/MocA family protein n=1 Tax=Bauldia sp. TaxID=2575872 RepID=UPI001D6C3630|nr:Gfo/Idh/MocA family oxidoreductase [Bauldia sp.]MCB1497730.1 Gfo/Idh/MocA family oxidoreductase [Bauldia sp.]
MAKRAAIGIIGCGVISDTYFELAPLFRGVEIVACADIAPASAKAKAEQYSVRALSVDALLKDAEIDAVINLTVPDAHYAVNLEILSAGKHAYTEKPLALTYKEARKLVAEADRRGLKLGAAPDTFLGAAGQTARRLLDKGAVGEVVGGTAHVLNHGMEHWHPSPTFFFRPGGGPIFDIGPYYLATLVNLLGPVKSVAAMAGKGFAERIVSADGPMKGKRIRVTTPTSINALLEFRSGAQVTIGASWDVWKHGHANPIEIYGTEGTMLVPDPNFFSGVVSCSRNDGDYVETDTASLPFGAANWSPRPGVPKRANYRMAGVADLVDAVSRDREPRCSGRLAAHIVEIMESILVSGRERRFVRMRSTTGRPAPLTAADIRRLAK